MKKILYIITQSEFGGAQRYIFDLATHIKNEFEVIDVKWPTGSWRDAVVTVRNGSNTGTVSFDETLLAVKTAPTAAPQGRPNPGVKLPTPGTPTPPGTRTPRPRVVVPKK